MSVNLPTCSTTRLVTDSNIWTPTPRLRSGLLFASSRIDPPNQPKTTAPQPHHAFRSISVGLEYLAFRLADGRPQPPASQSGRSNAHPGRANKERQPRAACLRPSSAPPATASRHVRAAPPRSAAMPPPLPRRARRRAHRHSPAILGKVGQGVAPALSLRDYPHQRNFDFSFSVFLYFCV